MPGNDFEIKERKMTELDRRDMFGAAALAATAAVTLASSSAEAQTPPPTGPYSIKPLPFNPASIKGLSEKILVSHHDNNYAGAVRRLNAIHAQFRALDVATAPVFTINGLKREELMAMNSMILHELYFDGLGAGGAPTGELAQALTRDFGSVARWQAEFSAMGKAEGGGSGWVLLTWSPHDKRLVNQWAADHTNGVAGGRPILALDMYEHSYHMDYGSGAAGYVDAYMAVINWNNAAGLFNRYSRES
jgi:Fe-Mn family superoxide dismutase